MGKFLIKNVNIINEGLSFTGNLLIEGSYIHKISAKNIPATDKHIVIDGTGKILIPGVIDDHVHFREPGLTHKADIHSESRAALAGGVTSFMEMPNTRPQTISIAELDIKMELASRSSAANYSFYLGATNDNIEEIKRMDPKKICGVKLFMGASTGNMLVDKPESLEKIFTESPVIIVAHCEDETTIRQNSDLFRKKYGENIPFKFHPEIRSTEACYKSSSLAVELARKYGAKLHLLHLSTADELGLLDKGPVSSKMVTAEVCIHHLLYNEKDYSSKGSLIKWNPAVKKESDRVALFSALLDDRIDVIATDHAPHTMDEKSNAYLHCPSGGPMVQHSLAVMLEFWKKGLISLEKIIQKMCHAPAVLFQIKKRGFIREGYYADLVLIDPYTEWQVQRSNILYKCGWSPLEEETFHTRVYSTFVNGEMSYSEGRFSDKNHSMPLVFER